MQDAGFSIAVAGLQTVPPPVQARAGAVRDRPEQLLTMYDVYVLE